jgi:hypothetical protein
MPKKQCCMVNHARGFKGEQTVNIHLKDGSTIPCVKIQEIVDDKIHHPKRWTLTYKASNKPPAAIPLDQIHYIEKLSEELFI